MDLNRMAANGPWCENGDYTDRGRMYMEDNAHEHCCVCGKNKRHAYADVVEPVLDPKLTSQYWTITGTGVQIGSEVNDAAPECFTDGAGDYSNDEKAQITAMQSGTLISHTGEILFI